MARAYPETPNPNTSSQAELLIFEALKEELSDDYTFFHSIAWQVRDIRGGLQDGETDFLILNQNLDILVIEVKGGKIKYDGKTGTWFSNQNIIKDPFRQVKNAKYSLLKKLKEIPKWGDKWINIGCVVSFPDIIVNDAMFLDAPRELILDFFDVKHDIVRWIRRAFSYLQKDQSYKTVQYPEEYFDSLIKVFSPSWEFDIEISREIETQEKIITHLTNDQFKILDFLSRHRRVAITGCAGSGKTLVAIEKASRLARDGFKTLLLCHNPHLAAFMEKKIKHKLIKIIDFYSWINSILSKNLRDDSNKNWSQFLEPSLEDLNFAFDKINTSEDRYDAIIVDEGQDFRETWWLLVESALQDVASGILYIFHDDNQALYLYGSQLKYPIQQAPYTLSKNCRNAGRIFELIQKIHPQAPELSLELSEKGVFKEYICQSESIISTLTCAVRDAMEVINNEHSLVILTAEICSPDQSVLSNHEIDISDKDNQIPRWQEAVARYTNISMNILSSDPYPTIGDIQKVTLQAQQHLRNKRNESVVQRHMCVHDNSVLPKPLKWGIDPSGRMYLRGLPEYKKKFKDQAEQNLIWRFFSDNKWAENIPKTKSKIKILSEFNNFASDCETYVPLHTVASFKGLEAQAVILFYWGHYPTGDELLALNTLYVGLSRARHLLYFISPISLSEVLSTGNIYLSNPDLFRINIF